MKVNYKEQSADKSLLQQILRIDLHPPVLQSSAAQNDLPGKLLTISCKSFEI